MRVAIACGGTGGHVYPALAVAGALHAADAAVEVLVIGGAGPQARFVARSGWAFRRVAARPLSRRVSWRTPWALVVTAAGSVQAVGHLRAFRPHVVLSTGGYAAAPVGAAAAALGIPLVLQEQNLYPGVTHRLLRRFARAVSVPHDRAARYFPGKAVVTGVPIDAARVLGGDREEGVRRFGLDPGRRTVLVLGGSQGAQSLNEAVVAAAPQLADPDRVQFLHQTGASHEGWIRSRVARLGRPGYVAVGYIEDVADAYACADLVICRAGASTLAEVTARGLPAILVPYPYAAEGHQELNARLHAEAGAAVLVPDRDLSGPRLAGLLDRLLGDDAALRAMADASRHLGRPDAAARVAAMVVLAAGEQT